mmetsp:Transcript_17449/g.26352  ORF Transcript_17449/g.26352 Transcript_17449/m.26352 type:complete len:88 (-) Transcript_17449:105-368(-)
MEANLASNGSKAQGRGARGGGIVSRNPRKVKTLGQRRAAHDAALACLSNLPMSLRTESSGLGAQRCQVVAVTKWLQEASINHEGLST